MTCKSLMQSYGSRAIFHRAAGLGTVRWISAALRPSTDHPSGGRPILPAFLAVKALQQHLAVFFGWHGHGRVANLAICDSPVLIRLYEPLARANCGYFKVSGFLNPFDLWICLRIDPLDLCAQLLNRSPLPCWPNTSPSGVTPNSRYPARWLIIVHAVLTAPLRVRTLVPWNCMLRPTLQSDLASRVYLILACISPQQPRRVYHRHSLPTCGELKVPSL